MEPLTIPQAAERWGISRQQAYMRLSAVGITPLKRGRYSYLSPEMVQRMDEVDGLLRQGFSLRDVADKSADLQTIDVQTTSVSQLEEPNAANGLEAFTVVLADAISKSSLNQPDKQNPLRNHEWLSRASDEQWTLSSKQVAECCGVSSSTTHGWNASVVRNGHRLERVGTGLWRVFRLIE